MTPPPSDPARWAALQAMMARCLALAWNARTSAARCVRAKQAQTDHRRQQEHRP